MPDIKNILTEIKTLRHELTPGTEKNAPFFMRAVRFLLDQQNREYREIVEKLFDTLEDGVPVLLDSRTFSIFVEQATDRVPEVVPISTYPEAKAYIQSRSAEFKYSFYGGSPELPDFVPATLFAITRDGRVLVNKAAFNDLEQLHEKFQRAVHGQN